MTPLSKKCYLLILIFLEIFCNYLTQGLVLLTASFSNSFLEEQNHENLESAFESLQIFSKNNGTINVSIIFQKNSNNEITRTWDFHLNYSLSLLPSESEGAYKIAFTTKFSSLSMNGDFTMKNAKFFLFENAKPSLLFQGPGLVQLKV